MSSEGLINRHRSAALRSQHARSATHVSFTETCASVLEPAQVLSASGVPASPEGAQKIEVIGEGLARLEQLRRPTGNR
jgi:hypothetical protein